MGAATTPRRFRRRLLVVMVTLGLLPLLTWALASQGLTSRVLAVRTAQLDALLSRVDEQLATATTDPALRGEVAAARLNLVQAELARRSLSHLLPRLLVSTLLISGAILCLAALVIGRQLARPVELLADGMARYARGDLAHRLPVSEGRADELQLLVRQFNRMGDELAAQRARLEVSEAIAAWQGVARSLAHELKNPLTAMRMAVARLARSDSVASAPLAPATTDAASAEARRCESLALVERQIDTLLRLAQSFSAFAKLPAPELRTIEIRTVVEDVCALYRHTSTVPVECDRPRGDAAGGRRPPEPGARQPREERGRGFGARRRARARDRAPGAGLVAARGERPRLRDREDPGRGCARSLARHDEGRGLRPRPADGTSNRPRARRIAPPRATRRRRHARPRPAASREG